ncbi:hypothetical protein [Brevundimonas sp. SORGH_AS_0993]|uniref:hypothetical protein n=1 Tax=Brevundimonas sp. SORGH_AS_0993 TaxID=3041794 RepID=UPI00278B1264|nr:hypothetical protein [Brevundimonas sp. SORGH_AS_0993]MDQ1154736.1 hypothetical protein [Brevundimonas sp. SORGH_AS_0993]
MSAVVFARYDRTKVIVLTAFFYALAVLVTWLIVDMLLFGYQGRRDPSVAFLKLVLAAVAAVPILIIATIHLMRALRDHRACLLDDGRLVVRGVTFRTVQWADVVAVRQSRLDQGRILFETAGGQKLALRSSLMRESEAEIIASVESELAHRP